MAITARLRGPLIGLRRPVLTMLALAVLWEGIARGFDVPASFFPPLSVVLADAWSVFPYLMRSVGRTFVETTLGFVTGSLFGIFCGVIFAYSRGLERALFPLFVVSQTIPVIAFGALIDRTANIRSGVLDLKPEHWRMIELARGCGATGRCGAEEASAGRLGETGRAGV